MLWYYHNCGLNSVSLSSGSCHSFTRQIADDDYEIVGGCVSLYTNLSKSKSKPGSESILCDGHSPLSYDRERIRSGGRLSMPFRVRFLFPKLLRKKRAAKSQLIQVENLMTGIGCAFWNIFFTTFALISPCSSPFKFLVQTLQRKIQFRTRSNQAGGQNEEN